MCRFRPGTRVTGGNPLRSGLRAAWHAMRARAGNADGHHPTYVNVSVDPRWSTFEGFILHQPAGQQYEVGLCLCRRNDQGDYTPENTRWLSKATNSREMTERDRMYRMTDGRWALDVARSNGISPTLFGTRIGRGWSPDEAATRRPRRYRTQGGQRVSVG